MSPENRPPPLYERLLERTLSRPIVREDVVGSMAEEHAERVAEKGARAADRWYRGQAIGIAIRAVLSRVRGRGNIGNKSDWSPKRPEEQGGGDPPSRKGWREPSTVRLDLRYTIRSLIRSPAATCVILLTLALGVGANTAMFSVVSGVLFTELPFPEADRVVSVWPEKRHSMEMIRELEEETSSFAAMSGFTGELYTLLGGREPEVIRASAVGHDFFRVVGVGPRMGRGFTADDAAGANGPVVILGDAIWRRAFGADSSIVGTTVELSGNGAERRTVIGVLAPDFFAFDRLAEVWTPLVTDPEAPDYYGAYGMSLIARLGEGVSTEVARQDVARLAEPFAERHPTQFREIRRSPVAVLPVHELRVRGVRTDLFLLLGAVGFVLLIACTNVANILLARANARSGEIGLRIALGAGSSRVARLVLTESLLLGIVGGVIGTAAAAISLPLLVARLESRLPQTELIALDAQVLTFALGISVLAGLLFGLAPALRSARQEPGVVMGASTGRGGAGRRRVRVNDTLVTAEVALSLVLVLAAGLMLKSLWRLSSVDPGFETERLLSMRLILPPRYDDRDERRVLFDEVLERLEAVPGVAQAAAINWLPLGGGSSGIPYRVEGQELPEGTPSLVGNYKIVSPRFFEIMGMRPLSGRLLASEDPEVDEASIVINEAMKNRHWPFDDPVGARIVSASSGTPIGHIVGVVNDIRQEELAEPSVPEFYFAGVQEGHAYRYLLLRCAVDPDALIDGVRAVIHEIAPNVPIRDLQTMESVVREELNSPRFYFWLFGGFAGLALLLGMVGVYGVLAYTVSQRTREIGVRLALGAGRREVVASTMRRAMGPVVVGIVLGLGGAAAASRLLTGFLFEVEPTDPWVFVAVATLLTAAGLLASALPAWRASRLDPVGALREG